MNKVSKSVVLTLRKARRVRQPKVIQREISRVLVLNLSGEKAVPRHGRGQVCP
jgi:hypothetical protein